MAGRQAGGGATNSHPGATKSWVAHGRAGDIGTLLYRLVGAGHHRPERERKPARPGERKEKYTRHCGAAPINHTLLTPTRLC